MKKRAASIMLFAFVLLSLACGGGRNKPSSNSSSTTSDTDAGPTIIVDADITELEFGKWTIFKGKDTWDRNGQWFTTTVKNMGKTTVKNFNYSVSTFNASGVKLTGGSIIFPELKPGETGEVQVRFDDAAKVVVSKRK